MIIQTELFPKTELDEATTILNHLATEEEKAQKTLESAQDKHYDAIQRSVKQRHVVARLQSMMPAAAPNLEAEDAEVLEIEGDVLDPITGEVASHEESDAA